MNVDLMGSEPELITLEGDRINLKSILSPADYRKFSRAEYLTGDDIEYLDMRYPELMGAWATIAAGVGKGLVGIGKRIAQRIRERRARRRGQSAPAPAPSYSQAPAPSPAQVQQQRAAQYMQEQAIYQAAAAEQKKKNMNMLLLAAAGIGIILVMQKKERSGLNGVPNIAR